MKTIILFSSSIFLFLNFAMAKDSCPIRRENPTLYKMANTVDANCSWTNNEIIKAFVLKKCEMALRNGDSAIRINNETDPATLKFTEFSSYYDTQDPNYFCKNQSGNIAYTQQLEKIITKEIDKTNRVGNSKSDHQRELRLKPNEIAPIPAPKKKRNWKCRVPGYVSTYKVVGEEEIDDYKALSYHCVELK